jgi:hypothetical protein
MELLNHLVAARLMKDAQLFERIGRYDATTPQLPRPVGPALAAPDLAPTCPDGAQPAMPGSRATAGEL